MRDGKNTNIWNDPWINNNTLRHLIHVPLTQNESNKTVSSIIHTSADSKIWNLNSISFQIPQKIIDQIESIALPNIQSNMNDGIYWNITNHGEFTLKSTYNNYILKN